MGPYVRAGRGGGPRRPAPGRAEAPGSTGPGSTRGEPIETDKGWM